MVRLDLDPEERQILHQVLEGVLSDLRMEIADTDLLDYRQMLRSRQQVIVKALEALRSSEGARAPGT